MSENSITSTKKLAFIDARLSQIRLVSMQAVCATLPSQSIQNVELRIDSSSDFSIGLDSPINPKIIVITIEYKAELKIPSMQENFVEYTTKHEAQFTLEGWTGFDDWTNLPSDAIAPYLTIVYNAARKKAEDILIEMGFKGVSLPQPERFDGALSLVS